MKTLFKYNVLLWLCSTLVIFQGCKTPRQMIKVSDILIDSHGKTINGEYGYQINGLSFQQDLLRTANGYQYIIYYNGDDRLCLSRRCLKNNLTEVICFSDYIYSGGNNAHCTPSLGLCSIDGTIHLAFDHHNNELHYKKSVSDLILNPEKYQWTEELFSPVQNYLTSDAIKGLCYPRFVHHLDGNLQFIYRLGGSGDGYRMLIDYNPQKSTWENTRQIDSGKGYFADHLGESTSRCSYPNGYTYDSKGILHSTFVWRESSKGANHDFMYAFSKDRGNTWLNHQEDTVGISGTERLIDISSPGIVLFDIGRDQSLMNTQAQDADSNGLIHAVMWHKKKGHPLEDDIWWTPSQAAYFHFYKNRDGIWLQNELPFEVGNRPSICFDDNDNLYLVYLKNHTPATWLNHIYFPKGSLIVAMAGKQDNWQKWKIVYTEEGPFLNEVKIDESRLKKDRILSLFLQETPDHLGMPSKIRILDLNLKE